MRTAVTVVTFGAVIGMVTWSSAARGAEQAAPAFDVASIKPAANDLPLGTTAPSPDRFYRAGTTLRTLIGYAYDMRDFRLVGGPAWMASDRWEVSAKAATAVTPGEMRLLVQQLLADRFALKVHRETRELPIYNMVLARRDGRLGDQMKAAELDCEPYRTGERRAPETPVDPTTGFPRCNISFRTGGGVTTARFNGTTPARLAVFLSPYVGRWIADRTGLDGSYDVEVTYQEERYLLPGATRRDAPALLTAVQEQLGLRLDADRGPVEVLVIDWVERPAPD